MERTYEAACVCEVKPEHVSTISVEGPLQVWLAMLVTIEEQLPWVCALWEVACEDGAHECAGDDALPLRTLIPPPKTLSQLSSGEHLGAELEVGG
jgi:hypothetical protein